MRESAQGRVDIERVLAAAFEIMVEPVDAFVAGVLVVFDGGAAVFAFEHHALVQAVVVVFEVVDVGHAAVGGAAEEGVRVPFALVVVVRIGGAVAEGSFEFVAGFVVVGCGLGDEEA